MLTFLPVNAWIVVPLLTISIILASFAATKKAKWIIIILMTVFIVMELISIYFSGGFADYQFYVNLNLNDIIEGLLIFKLQALLTIVAFILISILLIKLAGWCRKKVNILARLMGLVIMSASLIYHGGPLDKLMEIYHVVSAPNLAFTDALAQLDLKDYPTKEQITATKGKNIIVISLESFEQGFLDRKEITPNLNQLRQKYRFYSDIPMGRGSSWTTASMYTYMTGVPFLFADTNTMPLNRFSQTRLVSLADVLHKADYQTRYIIGNPTFAGIGHIIDMFNIDIISEANYPGEYPIAPFGLFDKDTFAIAQRQVKELAASDKPFALFISTISTHAPDGFYDQRMESVIDKHQDNMSFVAASLDYNLGQFITYLEQQGILDNTVFYIFPDHLMMGAATPTIVNLSKQNRFLYLLTNAESTNLGEYVSPKSNIYQIDLPRIILNGAQVNTNAQFWTDALMAHPDTNRVLDVDKNISKIATLNRAARIE